MQGGAQRDFFQKERHYAAKQFILLVALEEGGTSQHIVGCFRRRCIGGMARGAAWKQATKAQGDGHGKSVAEQGMNHG